MTTPVPLRPSEGRRRPRFGFGWLALGLVGIIVVLAAIYDARHTPAPVSLAPASPRRAAPVHVTPACRFSAAVSGSQQRGAGIRLARACADCPGHGRCRAGRTSRSSSARLARRRSASATRSGSASHALPAAPTAPVATPPAGAPGAAEIKLDFDDESWVEIKDGTGAVIFARLNPAGVQQVVSGEPPLDVVIGNAHSVRLTYRNKPVDLAPHTRVDVARVRAGVGGTLTTPVGPASTSPGAS